MNKETKETKKQSILDLITSEKWSHFYSFLLVLGMTVAGVLWLHNSLKREDVNSAEVVSTDILDLEVWVRVKEEGTAKSYEEFISTFPESPYLLEAQEALHEIYSMEDKIYEESISSQNLKSIYFYIKSYPEGRYLNDAEKLAFDILSQGNTIQDLSQFLKFFPESEYAPEINFRIGSKYFNQELYDEAVPWFENAASSGNGKAMHMLGDINYQGTKTVTRDLDKAKEFWKKALIHGDETANVHLEDK